jgi:UDP-glucose 4-epimerase
LKILRPSNVYGRFQTASKQQGVVAHLLHAALNNAVFPVWGDGNNLKDYLFAPDFAKAVFRVIEQEQTSERVFNISFAAGTSLTYLMEVIERETGRTIRKKFLPHASFDVHNIVLDNRKFSTAYNWKPAYSIEEGIRKLLHDS